LSKFVRDLLTSHRTECGEQVGVDRATTAEGRAAARRAKNSIRLVAVDEGRHYALEEACLVSSRPGAHPLARHNLAKGLGLRRSYLHEKMNQLGLSRPESEIEG
jgi:DNA-binding NtrC family response regulator